MNLKNTNTKWLFVCAIAHEKKNKSRHLKDISFGVFALLKNKIPVKNIEIIIDEFEGYEDEIFVQQMLCQFDIKGIDKLDSIIKECQNENFVVIFLGHGNENGLGTIPPIKSYQIIENLKSNNSLKCIALIFGQCYAGVFNYVDLQKISDLGEIENINICLMGASHLNSSLSGGISIEYANGVTTSWSANVFIYYFFDWLIFPSDVDGDQKYTLIDAFKYAGSKTSQKLILMKKELFSIVSQAQLELFKIKNELVALNKDLENEFDREIILEKEQSIFSLETQEESINEIIDLHIELSYINQDPWILNTGIARKIMFNLKNTLI